MCKTHVETHDYAIFYWESRVCKSLLRIMTDALGCEPGRWIIPEGLVSGPCVGMQAFTKHVADCTGIWSVHEAANIYVYLYVCIHAGVVEGSWWWMCKDRFLISSNQRIKLRRILTRDRDRYQGFPATAVLFLLSPVTVVVTRLDIHRAQSHIGLIRLWLVGDVITLTEM